jgi:hypothetical protein
LDISARSLRTDALTPAVALQKGGTLVKHNRLELASAGSCGEKKDAATLG